jgi:hypothetical protein
MASSKKNDDDSEYQDDSDDSDAVPSSTKKTAEEQFELAANATLPARKRSQPNIFGSTPSPSLPPASKPTKKKPGTSKKKPTAPLVNSARTNQSNNNSKTKKKRGRAATKKKTPSVPVTTTVMTNVPPGNPSLPMNGTFLGTLSVCFCICRAYRSSIFISFLIHPSHFNSILPHFSICKKKLHPLLILLSPP